MATVKELRATISANRESLKEAIAAASGKWEDANGEEWSPRRTAEHALAGDIRYATSAAVILGGNPPAKQELELATADAAVEVLTANGPENDRRYSWAEDRDLSKQAPSDPLSNAAPATLESVMESAASHLAEHAAQIKAAAG